MKVEARNENTGQDIYKEVRLNQKTKGIERSSFSIHQRDRLNRSPFFNFKSLHCQKTNFQNITHRRKTISATSIRERETTGGISYQPNWYFSIHKLRDLNAMEEGRVLAKIPIHTDKGFLKSKVETTRQTAERRANPLRRRTEWGKLIRNISFLAD